jgi:hypothetical protein
VRTAASKASQPPHPSPIVVRRVHASFDVPIKEEDDEYDAVVPDTAPHTHLPGPKRRVSTSAKSKNQKAIVDEGASSDDNEDGSGEYTEDRARAINTKKARRHSDMSRSFAQNSDDEEDELIMGGEVCSNLLFTLSSLSIKYQIRTMLRRFTAGALLMPATKAFPTEHGK